MLRLNKNKERGQIIIFMMFAIIPIVLLMAYIFNGGYVVAQKIRLQNAVDTSALMEASWTARSLNIMSMNNTALTQSLAITSAGWAMEKPLMDAGLSAGLVAGFYVGRAIKIATMCPPWCTILAPLVYGAMIIWLETKVMTPLKKLQEELMRSMHEDEETGFAKAATSFALMNRVLTEKFPESIETYSDKLLQVNYYGEASLIRYTAWGPDKVPDKDRMNAQMPVVEQSFRDALDGVVDAAQNSGSGASDIDSSTADNLNDALASIKDIRDVYNAGLTGTVTNPYSLDNLLTFNYFGNFRAQGYPDGTGPNSPEMLQELVDRFTTIYDDVGGFINGSALGDAIGDALDSRFGSKGPLNFIREIIEGVINAIFEPLIGTAYEDQETDPTDLQERLTEVYEWSTLYGETHYSNSWRVDAGLDLWIWNIDVPPRVWRGILPGIYHGYDLSNIADGYTFDEDQAEADADAAEDKGRQAQIAHCVAERRTARRNQYYAEKRAAKGVIYDGMAPDYPKYTSLPYETIPRSIYITLNASETAAENNRAETDLNAECAEEYRVEHDDAADAETVEDTGTADPPTGVGGTEFNQDADFASAHGDSSTSRDWSSPRGMQDYLEMVNWWFEPAYKMIRLDFPLDAALFAFIGDEFAGSARSAPDPNWWCGEPFGNEGFVCTNATPMYAINKQRIYPEFAGDILEHFGLDLDDLPEPIRANYAADRDDWSLVVAARAPIELPIYGAGFGQVPTEMSTIAQAEVYNAQWFDLFTQTWKSKLVPIEMLDDDDHYDSLSTLWEDDGYPFIDELDAATNDSERVLNH